MRHQIRKLDKVGGHEKPVKTREPDRVRRRPRNQHVPSWRKSTLSRLEVACDALWLALAGAQVGADFAKRVGEVAGASSQGVGLDVAVEALGGVELADAYDRYERAAARHADAAAANAQSRMATAQGRRRPQPPPAPLAYTPLPRGPRRPRPSARRPPRRPTRRRRPATGPSPTVRTKGGPALPARRTPWRLQPASPCDR